jgi:hypothetical protein
MTYGTKGSAAPDGGNYAHFSDPVTGYVNFVKNNPRYSNVKNSQDVYTEAKTIAADGWATDPNYASKIMGMKVDGSLAVDTSSSGSGSNSDSGSSAPSFGLSDIPNLISKSLGVLVGAGIVFLGIYIAMNPLGDLTTAIASAAKEFSKMPFEGATKAVKNAPNNFRKRKNENIKKNNEISGKRNEIASKRKEEKAIDKQMKLLDKHLAKLEKKKMG